jgi:hypothetical protein
MLLRQGDYVQGTPSASPAGTGTFQHGIRQAAEPSAGTAQLAVILIPLFFNGLQVQDQSACRTNRTRWKESFCQVEQARETGWGGDPDRALAPRLRVCLQ